MSIFPKCTFEVLVPNGRMVVGEHLEGELVLTALESIKRAERIVLVMESRAWAGYGGASMSRVMFRAGFKFDLPKDAPFAAGEHRYPFVMDLPDWLPPTVNQPDFSISHNLQATLDVDWAVDPVAIISPTMSLQPKRGTRLPVTMRSHPSFHESIVVEVTIASAVVSIGEMITGEVALRNGNIAELDWIDLTLMSVAKMVMGQGERRNTELSRVRIPATALREGAAAPFAFEVTPAVAPSFRTSFIDHDVVLRVSAQIPWRVRPTFEIPLEVLPEGSVIDGAAGTSAVGGDRLRRISHAMAEQAGLIEGARRPTLAYGNIGAVKLAILDAPKKGTLGVDLDFTFPDLELGIIFGDPSILETLYRPHESALLPRALANYRLKCVPPDHRPKLDDRDLAKLVQAMLGDPTHADDVRFSDHHLAFHVSLVDDEEPRMIEIARSARAHAKAIGDAISQLPFPKSLSESRAAWQQITVQQNAFLIPSGPSIHNIVLRAQVVGGEERSMVATLRTIFKTKTPTLHVFLDLRENLPPEKSWKDLEDETTNEQVKAIRAIFPSIQLSGRHGEVAVLQGATWPTDPRSILSILEIFLAWLIEARGERRVDSPYR